MNAKMTPILTPPMRRVLLLLIASGLLLLGIRTLPPGESEAADARDEPAVVESFQVRTQPSYQTARAFVGRVESARSSALAFELGGLLVDLRVDEGEPVRANQVIARLDSQRLRSRRDELSAELDSQKARLDELRAGPRPEQIERARAEVAAWEARLELATLTSTRTEEAFRLNAISAREWDEARLERKTVGRQLEVAREQLRELETGTREEKIAAQQGVVRRLQSQIATIDIEIRKKTLRAPYDGTIASRSKDEGEVVAAGDPVATLIESDRLEARVGVAPDQTVALKPNSEHLIDVSGRQVVGRVKTIVPVREPSTRTVDVLLELAETTGVRDGDLVRLTLTETVEQAGFWIPLSALTESVRGLWAVLVLQPVRGSSEGSFLLERRELEVLAQTQERAFVVGTLRDGERIAFSGLHLLTPGQLVRIN